MHLTEHFKQIRQRAIEAFLRNGVLLPLLYYLRGNKIVAVTPMLFEAEQKQAAHREILEKARSLGVDGFIEASESWYVAPEDREPGEPELPPSKHAKKRECVMMVGRQLSSSGIETQVRLYEIIRIGKQVDLVRRYSEEPKRPEGLRAWFDSYFSAG